MRSKEPYMKPIKQCWVNLHQALSSRYLLCVLESSTTRKQFNAFMVKFVENLKIRITTKHKTQLDVHF